jgi:RNA polymerase sigma-70 factor (ECF subfamily)
LGRRAHSSSLAALDRRRTLKKRKTIARRRRARQNRERFRKIAPHERYFFMANFASRQTSPSLLVRIRDSRDVSSWRTFVDLYGPLVYRYGRRHGLQDADAADVAQEVLAQVARSVRDFEYQPERGRFRDWLGLMTHRKLLNWREKQGRHAAGKGGDSSDMLASVADPQADGEWAVEFNRHVLHAALERVRPRFAPVAWRAFELVWLHDRPAPEAARELGLSVAAVYVAKSRALKELREEILMLAEDIAIG